MTTTPTPTSGAADLPEAGCSKHHLIHCSQCRHDNMVRDLRAENDRLTTQLAELAAGQATAAQENADRLKGAVGLLEELAEHDSYSTEYDGQMITICPDCGEQEGEHRHSCAFVRAKAYLAARKQGETA